VANRNEKLGGRGIYLAGSISAGREFSRNLPVIARAIEGQGFQILSESVLDPGEDLFGLSREKAKWIFRRDVDRIAESVGVIAEVSTPSFGVGYEICEALHCAKPVLCLRHQSLEKLLLSALIFGNTSPLISVQFYEEQTVDSIVAEFLSKIAR